MMIKQIKNIRTIKKMLIEDQEIYDRISNDYTNIAIFNPNKFSWIGWYDGDICKGIMQVGEETETVLNIHPAVPKPYRVTAYTIVTEMIEFLEENSNKKFIKINVKIPTLYPEVIKFAKKCGFDKEGVDRKSHVKNGKIYDKIMLGKEIKR